MINKKESYDRQGNSDHHGRNSTNRSSRRVVNYFDAADYVLLDNLILRDLKIEYKNNALKKGYPQDLVIKAAVSRYRESLGYLECKGRGSPI